jgi:hypothetical protein
MEAQSPFKPIKTLAAPQAEWAVGFNEFLGVPRRKRPAGFSLSNFLDAKGSNCPNLLAAFRETASF